MSDDDDLYSFFHDVFWNSLKFESSDFDLILNSIDKSWMYNASYE